VQIFRPAAGGAPARVTLDAAAIERAVAQLGQPVWSRERPLVLGGDRLSAPAGADAATARVRLERAAVERGLPLRLGAAASGGARCGMPHGLARSCCWLRGAPEPTWRSWARPMARTGSGRCSTARPPPCSMATSRPASRERLIRWHSVPGRGRPAACQHGVTVSAASGLKDYADVQQILESQPAVRSAELIAADGEGRGSASRSQAVQRGLAEALASQPRLRREGGDGWRRYRYAPCRSAMLHHVRTPSACCVSC
jgi:hypothetical protein